MAAETIQISSELKKELKRIGLKMNPHTVLKYPQIIETLIAVYEAQP